MGSIDLALLEFKDRANPINWIGNIDRNDMRSASRILTREYLADEKKFKKRADQFKQNVDTGSIEGVYLSFEAICIISQHELKTDVKAFLKIILALRRQFLRLQKVERREKNPKFKDLELKDLKKFQKGAESLFDKIESQKSLTIQLSDIASLRQEIAHLLDMFNLQSDARKLLKSEKKLGKDVKKTGEKAEKKEAADLNTFETQLDAYFKRMEILFTDLIKLMQLEIDANNRKLNLAVSKLQELKYPNESLKLVQARYAQTNNDFEKSFKELEEQVNALIRTTKSA